MLGFVIFISKRRFVSLQNQFFLENCTLFCNCQKCHLPFDPFFNFHVSKNHHIKVKIFARCCKMCVVDKIPILFLVCLDTADQSSRVLEQFTNSSLFCCWTLLFHFTCVYVKIWRKKSCSAAHRPVLWKTASWGMQHNCLLMPWLQSQANTTGWISRQTED